MEKIVNYYEKKLKKYGATFKGVDWNSYESQNLRFKKLTKSLIEKKNRYSLLDYGCGYGALLKYINDNYDNIDYFGYDFSKSMIKQAKIINDNLKKTSWLSELKEADTFDYIIASGIFNVKLNYHHTGWLKQVIETLDKINSISKKGFHLTC